MVIAPTSAAALAAGSAISNLDPADRGEALFHPVWSMLMITLDAIVIYALIVHGSELKKPLNPARRRRDFVTEPTRTGRS